MGVIVSSEVRDQFKGGRKHMAYPVRVTCNFDFCFSIQDVTGLKFITIFTAIPRVMMGKTFTRKIIAQLSILLIAAKKICVMKTALFLIYHQYLQYLQNMTNKIQTTVGGQF